jgi:hypothetical protein
MDVGEAVRSAVGTPEKCELKIPPNPEGKGVNLMMRLFQG